MSGSFAMGAKYFDRPDDLVLARQIAQGCYLGYHHSGTGLGPEAAQFTTSTYPGKFIPHAEKFFNPSLSRKDYILRPGKKNTAARTKRAIHPMDVFLCASGK